MFVGMEGRGGGGSGGRERERLGVRWKGGGRAMVKLCQARQVRLPVAGCRVDCRALLGMH